MTHQEIVNGLLQLGFAGGWVITGNEITPHSCHPFNNYCMQRHCTASAAVVCVLQ
jgi:hypothetical protein